VVHVAQIAATHELAYLLRVGAKALVHAHGEDALLLCGAGDHGLGLGCVHGEGLLQDHVFALAQRRERERRVVNVGRRDVDAVDVRVGEERLGVEVAALDRELVGELGEALGVQIGGGHHLRVRVFADLLAGDVADLACAHHP
jgi:hypothetical protein